MSGQSALLFIKLFFQSERESLNEIILKIWPRFNQNDQILHQIYVKVSGVLLRQTPRKKKKERNAVVTDSKSKKTLQSALGEHQMAPGQKGPAGGLAPDRKSS